MAKYVCVKQHNLKDCGVAALATVCKSYGYEVPISRLRELTKTDKRGTTAFGLVTALEQLGFRAKGFRADINALKKEMPLPAIVHVVINKSYYHYLVIHKIDKKREKIIVADSNIGICSYNFEEFNKIWTGVIIIISPPSQVLKFEKEDSIIISILKLLKPEFKILINIFVLSIFYTVLGIIGSFYLQFVIDYAISDVSLNNLNVISLSILFLIIFKVILNFLRNYLVIYLNQNIDSRIVLKYFFHILKLPLKFYHQYQAGDLISRFYDINFVRNGINNIFLTIIVDFPMLIVAGIILYLKNSILFNITIILTSSYFLLITLFYPLFSYYNEKEKIENAYVTGKFIESIKGIEVIKANNLEDKVKIFGELAYLKLLNTNIKISKLKNLQNSLKDIVELLGELIILWVGSRFVITNNLSFGELLTFNSLLLYFLGPIRRIVDLQALLQELVISFRRIYEILNYKLESKELTHPITFEKLKDEIKFINVSFSYGARRPIFKDFNFNIKKGEKILIMGGNGMGKSTIAKLLLGLIEPESGKITIDGINLKNYSLSSVRSKIGYISQKDSLFNDTVLNNITMKKLDFDENLVFKLIKDLGLDKVIERLPRGLDSILEEEGKNLSGGEKQKLIIARVLLKRPDILILDEFTNELDKSSEEKILKYLFKNYKEKTIIIISHRPTLTNYFDRVLELKNGRLEKIDGTY